MGSLHYFSPVASSGSGNRIAFSIRPRNASWKLVQAGLATGGLIAASVLLGFLIRVVAPKAHGSDLALIVSTIVVLLVIWLAALRWLVRTINQAMHPSLIRVREKSLELLTPSIIDRQRKIWPAGQIVRLEVLKLAPGTGEQVPGVLWVCCRGQADTRLFVGYPFVELESVAAELRNHLTLS